MPNTGLAYHCHATLTPCPAEQLLGAVRAEFSEHDLDIIEHAGGLGAQTEYGRLRFQAQGNALMMECHSDDAANLFILRESVELHLAPVLQPMGIALDWQGHRITQPEPPHFRHAHVVARTRISPGFMRIRVAGADLARFAQGGLHFRLLLPPQGRTPIWPRVDARGSTVWPKGPDSLHAPVYTVRAIDANAGWLEFDVFLHGRGRTCHWALSDESANAQVGLLGPGGGDVPDVDRPLWLAGDETALPAIARIIKARTSGPLRLFLRLDDADMDLVPALPDSTRITRCADQEALTRALLSAPRDDRPFIWASCEKEAARTLRSTLKSAKWPRDAMQIAAYWSHKTSKSE